MRSLIRELPYEQPIAAGRYHYRRAGVATGAHESWRLSAAADGYRFLRVDLNADAGESGKSFLFHLTMNAQGNAERLHFRVFGRPTTMKGTVLFEDGTATCTRDVGDERYEETLPYRQHRFWFPATAGLSLLADLASREGTSPGLTLDTGADMALRQVELAVEPQRADTIQVMGRDVATEVVTVRWQTSARTLWLDEHRWPLRMETEEKLTAVETRYMRYQRGPDSRT